MDTSTVDDGKSPQTLVSLVTRSERYEAAVYDRSYTQIRAQKSRWNITMSL